MKEFEKGKMVPVPSHSIIPERDIGKTPVLEVYYDALGNPLRRNRIAERARARAAAATQPR